MKKKLKDGKVKLRNGYYFRMEKGTECDPERHGYDSMCIIYNNEVMEVYTISNQSWIHPFLSKNLETYTKFFHLEFMGDL